MTGPSHGEGQGADHTHVSTTDLNNGYKYQITVILYAIIIQWSRINNMNCEDDRSRTVMTFASTIIRMRRNVEVMM